MLKCNWVLIHIVITIGLTSKSLIFKSESGLLGWSGPIGKFMSGFGRVTQSIYGKQSIAKYWDSFIHSCDKFTISELVLVKWNTVSGNTGDRVDVLFYCF